MKASRSVAHWSASVRQVFVGAYVIGSLSWGIQPVHAHGDVKGGAVMPDTSSAADDGLSIRELRLLYAMGIPHRLGEISH